MYHSYPWRFFKVKLVHIPKRRAHQMLVRRRQQVDGEKSNTADPTGTVHLSLLQDTVFWSGRVNLTLELQARSYSQMIPINGNESKPGSFRLTLQHPRLFASSSSALPLSLIAFFSTSALSASNQCFLPLRSHRPPLLRRILHPKH